MTATPAPAPVRALHVGDHARAGAVIGEAFHDDPPNLWVFGGTKAIIPTFTKLAQLTYLPRGFGEITAGDEGATLWLAPGAKKDLGLLATLSVAATIFRHGGLGAMRRGLAIDAAMKDAKPTVPHYYLFAIGVRPGFQGKGFGKQLMRGPLARADAEGMPVYLESSKAENIPFYRSFGFELTDEMTMPDGCPKLWPMWREARG